MPYRALPELDLTEGPHLGYAVQWFIFASLLGVGYPIYVRREEFRQQPQASLLQRPYIRALTQKGIKIPEAQKEDPPR
jgi:hypothetical protein